MMSKILTKTVKKAGILSIILAVVLAAALTIGIIFGFNGSVKIKDSKTFTVSLDQYVYLTKAEDVEKECEKAFKKLDFEYEIKGEMSGSVSEIVYVFDNDVKTADLETAKTALVSVFEAWEATYGEDIVEISIGEEKSVQVLPEGYVLRGLIAGAVFVVLAFVYVAFRYNVKLGALTALSSLLGMALTAGLIALTRIPVTASVTYVFAVAALLAAVTTLLSFNKIRANGKDDAEKSEDEKVLGSIAVYEIVLLTVLLGGSLILVGALATVSTRWFALAALVSVLVAAFIGLIYMPALYLFAKKVSDKKMSGKNKSGYVGAKKTSQKKQASVVEVEETPAEEAAEKVEVSETEEVEATTEEEVSEEETAEVEETEVAEEEEVSEETPVNEENEENEENE